MEQITENLLKPAEEVTKEYKVAKEVNNIVVLDLKQLELYQKQLDSLHLEATLRHDIETIEMIEAQYILLSRQLVEVIGNYKKMGMEAIASYVSNSDLYKTVGHYKDEMEKHFIIKKLTHKLYDIPEVIIRIIDMETATKMLEMKIDEKKFIALNPNKKWEAFGGREFSIQNQTNVINDVREGQEAFIKNKVQTMFSSNETIRQDEHLMGIEELTKNASASVDAYNNTTINNNNVIGLSAAIGIANTLIKGLMKMVAFEVNEKGEAINKSNYINVPTYQNQIKYHLDDYTLIAAVGADSIEEIKLVISQMEAIADNFIGKKAEVNGILGEMTKIASLLETKQVQICEIDYAVKENNKVKQYLN